MQIGFIEIYDTFAFCILDICISDVPLLRYGPVKDRGSGRYLMYCQWDVILEKLQGLSYPITSNAAAKRIQISNDLVHLLADVIEICSYVKITKDHYLHLLSKSPDSFGPALR